VTFVLLYDHLFCCNVGFLVGNQVVVSLLGIFVRRVNDNVNKLFDVSFRLRHRKGRRYQLLFQEISQ